jgi:hypothetical protein
MSQRSTYTVLFGMCFLVSCAPEDGGSANNAKPDMQVVDFGDQDMMNVSGDMDDKEDLGLTEDLSSEKDIAAEPCDGLCERKSQFCDTTTNNCVDCRYDSDCVDPANSYCSRDNVCVPCREDSECRHLDYKTVCNDGVCQECGASQEATCGALSCDVKAGTCTTTPKKSIKYLEACKSDSECDLYYGYPMYCVPMKFKDQPLGGFCWLDSNAFEGGGCGTDRYKSERITTLSGYTSNFCMLDQTLQTLRAEEDYVRNKDCMGPDGHDLCGVENIDDGYCHNRYEGIPITPSYECTYFCRKDTDCHGSGSLICDLTKPLDVPNVGYCRYKNQ